MKYFNIDFKNVLVIGLFSLSGALVVGAMIGLSGCSIKKSPSTPVVGDASGAQGSTNEWRSTVDTRGGVKRTVRERTEASLENIRRAFGSPTLTPVTVPEANGYEIYTVSGYGPLENKSFIHPQVLLSTSVPGSGSSVVVVKDAGTDDTTGAALSSLTVQVAMVDGLSAGIRRTDGTIAALPAGYVIQDKVALAKAVAPNELKSLNVCPTGFRLVGAGADIYADSPFAELSDCPLNQLFPVTFTAEKSIVAQILADAPRPDDTVQLITTLARHWATERTITELTIPSGVFEEALKAQLSGFQTHAHTASGKALYRGVDLDTIISDSLFQIVRGFGGEAVRSVGMGETVSEIIGNYFSTPTVCSGHANSGWCHSLRDHPTDSADIKYRVTIAEEISVPIESETTSTLSSLESPFPFQAIPAAAITSDPGKPAFFSGMALEDGTDSNRKPVKGIFTICKELQDSAYLLPPIGWPHPETWGGGESAIRSPDQIELTGYCDGIISSVMYRDINGSVTKSVPHADGYYPLGGLGGLGVYPGAWIKFNFTSIAEFTKARSTPVKDPSGANFDVVEDLINILHPAEAVCTLGARQACSKYQTTEIDVLQPNGDNTVRVCVEGSPGCNCTDQPLVDGSAQAGGKTQRVCTTNTLQKQEVRAYNCDEKDQFDYCPYHHAKPEQVLAKEAWNCQPVKGESYTSFLCFGGCWEKNAVRCDVASQEYATVMRDHADCKGYDPEGRLEPLTGCKKPKYLCAEWEVQCLKYEVKESLQIVHEDPAPKWREFAISQGEYPARFLDQVFIKFTRPGVTDGPSYPLSRFARISAGNQIYIKIPRIRDRTWEAAAVPGEKPLWSEDDQNLAPEDRPAVSLMNNISYPVNRPCGTTEYQFQTLDVTKESTAADGVEHDVAKQLLVPMIAAPTTTITVGPVPGTCRALVSWRKGDDLWYTDLPPVRFSGTVSILGNALDSLTPGGAK